MERKGKPKQNRPGNIITTISLNGREATSTKGAIALLQELTGYRYSRDAIYRLYIMEKIEGERTDIANLYYLDSLRKVAPTLTPDIGRRQGQARYPLEMREQARQLHEQGWTNRDVAAKLGVTNQTVNYWLKKQ